MPAPLRQLCKPEPNQPRISWRNTQEINPHRQACITQTEGWWGARRCRQLHGKAWDSTNPRAQLQSNTEDRLRKAKDVGSLELTGKSGTLLRPPRVGELRLVSPEGDTYL